ncbi:4a-hydroxytetrahydrobiopterin dehydratase [Saccharomyces cerevisiae]|nr:4a-hydroxytetrahydrobiopterin dehydratase [Saccharomyces cerevisiae]
MHNKIVRIASSALTGGKLLEKLKPLTRWEVQWDPNKTKCLGITREVTFKDYETTWGLFDSCIDEISSMGPPSPDSHKLHLGQAGTSYA